MNYQPRQLWGIATTSVAWKRGVDDNNRRKSDPSSEWGWKRMKIVNRQEAVPISGGEYPGACVSVGRFSTQYLRSEVFVGAAILQGRYISEPIS